jgi:pyruvate dehydrogenase E2 component (dihydrolipoamide acetyltransferase)
MPALSPSMERGKIQKWNFKEGDKIEIGEAICEVETDKSTVGFEATEEFYLAKILVPEGEEVEVGHNVAVVVDNEEDVSSFKDFKPSDAEEEKSSSSSK